MEVNMLEKILKKFGYVKVIQDKNELIKQEQEKNRLEKLKSNFNELMTYSFYKAVKGDK
jgi:hypothetical protein